MASAWEDTQTDFGGTILRPVDIDDDESNLKDNWDDEDEPAPQPAPKPQPKKAEKKKKFEPEPVSVLTAEQLAQQKIDAEKRVREVDLELAKEMLGTKINASDVSFSPETPEQFDKLNSFLISLISSLSGSPNFPEFNEKFTREIAVSLDIDILKRMSEIISAVLNEKNKLKQQEKKSKAKAKGIKLRVDQEISNTGEEDLFGAANEEGEDYYDEMADKYDFM